MQAFPGLIFLSNFLIAFLICVNVSAAEPSFQGTYPIKAVATVGMVADGVKQIGGEHIQVQTIIGQGGDPHLYKASPKDTLLLSRSDIIFYNGLFLEGKMADVLDKYSQQKPALAVGEKLSPELLLKPEGFQGHFDPHVWMDVSLWQKTIQPIVEKLCAFDPKHQSEYRENASAYEVKLGKLHAYIKQLIQSIPLEQRVLVTAHDAFNYFSRAYNIEVRGIQGISTESEAGLKDINMLVDFIVARKIKAVFVESSVSQKNVMALIEGARSRKHQLLIGGELFSDAMGAPGTYEGTYIGMLEHNAKVITANLGGTVPSGGFEGWVQSSPHKQ